MHIEFLVEELSTQEFLLQVLPKIFAEKISYKIHPFRGKSDLLKKLPSRMKGYKSWLPDYYKIVVLVDRDDDDCINLKHQLEKIAKDSGFITKSIAKKEPYRDPDVI